jgi:cyclohexanecarboxylate-CoA ligase
MTSADRLLRERTVWGLVERRAALTPDRPALYDEHGARLSFAELRDRALRTAAHLHSLGIGPGSRVAWQLPTRISTALTMLALARLGAFQAPLIHLYREHELSVLLPAAKVDHFLVPGIWRGFDYVQLAARSRTPVQPVVVGPEGLEAPVGELPPPPADPDEPRWAYATSGSSGAPKAATHSDSGLLTSAYGFTLHGRLGEQDDEVGAIPFPMGHVGGILYLSTMLIGGFPAVIVEAFDPATSTELFRRHRVTVAGGSPVFYQAILEQQRKSAEPVLPTLRLLKGGGAPLTATLYRTIRKELGVQVAHDYGMTEAPLMAVGDPADPDEVLAETDGRIIPGVQVRTIGADGLPTLPGAEGELQLLGMSVTQGYTDPALNAEAFTDDGWFRTGDLGRVGPAGHVTVTGRLKDLIIRNGENISPLELEEALQSHPEIAEVVVIGLPDAKRGERACAVVRLHDEGSTLTLDDVRDHLRAAGLMTPKFPEQLEILPEIPRAGLGKAAKAELRARFSTTEADHSEQLLGERL